MARSRATTPSPDNLSDWIDDRVAYSAAAGDGVTIAANNVTLSNINIDGFANGVRFASDVSNTTLTNVDVSNTLIGIEKSTDADINGLTVTGGSFTDGYIGIDFAKDTAAGQAGNGLATNVTISGTHFEDMTAKGIYVEALSNALITGVTMDHVGFYGGAPPSAVRPSLPASGIEVNLKNGVYHDITITGFNLTDTGVSNGTAASHDNAAAISVKTRDDAPSYNGTPATWTGGDLVISNGTIDGTSTGIRAGETNKNVAGPPVDINGVTITDALHDAQNGDVENVSQSVLTVNGTAETIPSRQPAGHRQHRLPRRRWRRHAHRRRRQRHLQVRRRRRRRRDRRRWRQQHARLHRHCQRGERRSRRRTATGYGVGGFTNIQNVSRRQRRRHSHSASPRNKLTGGGGNDTLTGGGGNDTAVYTTTLALTDLIFNRPAAGRSMAAPPAAPIRCRASSSSSTAAAVSRSSTSGVSRLRHRW